MGYDLIQSESPFSEPDKNLRSIFICFLFDEKDARHVYFRFINVLKIPRVPTAQRKQGKWPKDFPVIENTGNLEIVTNHRENTGNSVCSSFIMNSLILKIKHISIFYTKRQKKI